MSDLDNRMKKIENDASKAKLIASRNQSVVMTAAYSACAVALTVIDYGPHLQDVVACVRGISWTLAAFSAIVAVIMTANIKS